jgi:hypothetical protein
VIAECPQAYDGLFLILRPDVEQIVHVELQQGGDVHG